MKTAVIGGTGLIGSPVVEILNAGGNEAVPHSPSTGVDLLSGQGLPEALNSAGCPEGRSPISFEQMISTPPMMSLELS